ncbi:MAG: hypothetical protein AAF206_07210 [Bacteroidota bacterium]
MLVKLHDEKLLFQKRKGFFIFAILLQKMLRKYSQHIGLLMLVLMGSTILPVRHLHDCDAHQHAEHANAPDDDHVETDCDLCDMVFAAMHPQKADLITVHINCFVPQAIHTPPTTTASLIRLPGLRAPPV